MTRRVSALQTAIGTNVNHALHYASEYLQQHAPSGRRVIILVSDMDNDMGNISDDRVEQQLTNLDVGLFGIRQVADLTASQRPWHGRRIDADRMAKTSGGFILDVPNPAKVDAAMVSLIKTLKSRYTLGFYPRAGGQPGAIRDIQVRLKNPSQQKSLSRAKLQYRLRYRLPLSAPAAPNNAP
jgi:hypothetical protein